MANKTAVEARNVHGTNPQFLVEKITRTRIYESMYWKEHCFALNAETLIDKASNLEEYGGSVGALIKPTHFLCLTLKLLQLQPEKEIIYMYIEQPDFKYVRILGAFYLRLVGNAVEIYQKLEPLYQDFRKLRFLNNQGNYVLSHVDEFVDELLHAETVCGITVPRIPKRYILELSEDLEPREPLLTLEDDDHDEDEQPAPEGEQMTIDEGTTDKRHDTDMEKRQSSPKRRRQASRSPRRRRSPQRRDSHSPRRRYSRSRSPRRRDSRSPRGQRDSRSPRRRHSRSRSPRRRSSSSPESRHRRRSPARDSRKYDDRYRSKNDGMRLQFKSGPGGGGEQGQSSGTSKLSEIEEANALRAKLGLKPLQM